MTAKELPEEGIRKQVGNEKSINIWEDKWLPETKDGRVKTRDVEGIKVQRVSELIKDGKWEKELIAQVFENEEGRKIMRIPFSVQPMKDQIYWAMSSPGVYTSNQDIGWQNVEKGGRISIGLVQKKMCNTELLFFMGIEHEA